MQRTLLLAAAVALAGCYPDLQPKLCGQIPEGGCPDGRGGTCDDPLCAALYDCVDGDWTKTETCDGNGGAGGGTTSTGTTTSSTGGCAPVMLDHTGETSGCKPDLQQPDCPAVAAEQCAESACLTDCTDFFMCMQDGWIAVAYCDADGTLIPTQR